MVRGRERLHFDDARRGDLELSISAMTDRAPPIPISFSETEMPTEAAAAVPLPRLAERAIAKPPVSERMLESSLALMVTSPAVAVTPCSPLLSLT